MQKLPFTHNWNGKLFLDCFGTVRLHNPEKYFVGSKLEAELKNQSLGVVEVVAVRVFRFEQISDALSFLDVGKPSHYLANLLKTFYMKNVKVDNYLRLDHAICKYTHKNIPVHAALLKDWWQEQLDKQPLSVQQEIF